MLIPNNWAIVLVFIIYYEPRACRASAPEKVFGRCCVWPFFRPGRLVGLSWPTDASFSSEGKQISSARSCTAAVVMFAFPNLFSQQRSLGVCPGWDRWAINLQRLTQSYALNEPREVQQSWKMCFNALFSGTSLWSRTFWSLLFHVEVCSFCRSRQHKQTEEWKLDKDPSVTASRPKRSLAKLKKNVFVT